MMATATLPNRGDVRRTFLFEGLAIRGVWVQLDCSWRRILAQREYPGLVAKTLGQALAACAMLTSTVKVDGRISLELRGNKGLRFLAAECSSDCAIRGIGHWEAPLQGADLHDWTGGGLLVVSIIEKARSEPYQGIVSLESGSLASALGHYFENSEQLPTRFFLAADHNRAAGLMLQKLPVSRQDPDAIVDPDAWNRISLLAATTSDRELLDLAPGSLVTRLFPEERIRLFPESEVFFQCRCSRARVAATLRLLGEAEVRSILRDIGWVGVTCEYCGEHYRFDSVDALLVFHQTATDIPATTQ